MEKRHDNSKAVATSVRLSETGKALWDKTARSLGISKASVIEIAIRKFAQSEGVMIDLGETLSGATVAASAAVLAREWDTPAEDAAWQGL